MGVIKSCWLEEFSFCTDDLIPAESKKVKGGRWTESENVWKIVLLNVFCGPKKLRARGEHKTVMLKDLNTCSHKSACTWHSYSTISRLIDTKRKQRCVSQSVEYCTTCC